MRKDRIELIHEGEWGNDITIDDLMAYKVFSTNQSTKMFRRILRLPLEDWEEIVNIPSTVPIGVPESPVEA